MELTRLLHTCQVDWTFSYTTSSDGRYTREHRAIASTGQFTTLNGLPGGQYAIPMLDWIQPEQIVPGQEPPLHYFDDMNHLTQGIGPDEEGNFFGPLDPFPQTGVTTFDISTCPEVVLPDPEDPEGKITGKIRISASTSTTSVNNDLYVRNEDTFYLTGSQINPSEVFSGNDISYSWSIVNSESVGTVANLNTFTFSADNKTATVKFSNPAPVGDYLFRLTLTSASQNRTATADFNVILFSGPDQVTIQSVTWSSTQSGTLGVTCKSNYLYDSKVGMMVTCPGDDGAQTTVMAATLPTPEDGLSLPAGLTDLVLSPARVCSAALPSALVLPPKRREISFLEL